ncbi:unnamed protein product [Medioppia subpectinata]|uniref:Uncharacterized protein n=1 Tax=Medioppia subpectinata TaxID=1979941 RepID=A0A7R9LQ57_9ACAR|nr:unnamed protein product [Medioppia subpectinata]CAG2120139.1 unnamed protein product [Medioppia subpectinata]
MYELWVTVRTVLYLRFRSVLKWFLRKTTKLCELQRLCYANNVGAKRTKGVEYSICMSQSQVLRKINVELSRLAEQQLLTNKWILFEKAIDATATDKRIDTKVHIEFVF